MGLFEISKAWVDQQFEKSRVTCGHGLLFSGLVLHRIRTLRSTSSTNKTRMKVELSSTKLWTRSRLMKVDDQSVGKGLQLEQNDSHMLSCLFLVLKLALIGLSPEIFHLRNGMKIGNSLMLEVFPPPHVWEDIEKRPSCTGNHLGTTNYYHQRASHDQHPGEKEQNKDPQINWTVCFNSVSLCRALPRV